MWRIGAADAGNPGNPGRAHQRFTRRLHQGIERPELLLEAEKGKMDVDPSPGEELEALIRNVMDQPKEVLDRVKKMLEN